MILPLTGVRVVELASNIAGPFATLILQDLGASVVKIERPRTGDDVRSWPPFQGDTSAPFAAMNRGKRSVVCDIKSEEGRARTQEMLREADAFVVAMRPGKLANVGLAWRDLESSHPHLIYCELSGYGPSGPMAKEPGYDAILQAYSGLMDLTGHPEGPPARVGTGILDFGTGLWAALGVVAALRRRDLTGRGGLVQANLLATSVGFVMHHIASMTMGGTVPHRIGTAQHNAAPYEALQAADGQVMVGVTSGALWSALCGALECPEMISDPEFATNEVRVRNRRRLVEMLNQKIGDRTARQVVQMLRNAGVPASEIRSIEAILSDEQVAALGLIQTAESGERLAVSPLRFDGQGPSLVDKHVPRLGEDTESFVSEGDSARRPGEADAS